MISITVTIQGESDTKPYTVNYHYPKKSDEMIFFQAAKMIDERLCKGLRININETITIFASYIVAGLRKGKTGKEIVKEITQILTPGQVLIGVPESLREVEFVALVDHIKETITVQTPIPVNEYVLGAL
jgi:urease gamma subunit